MKRKALMGLFFLFAVSLASGCLDTEDDFDPVEQARIDRERIVQYLNTNNIQATEHSSGIYYQILQEGSGPNPGPQSIVRVRYKGTLLDGTVFDQTTGTNSVEFSLRSLIAGWQIAIPLLKAGGSGRFYIPSALAYGPSQVGIIPANSVLIFDIELVDFQ